MVNTELPIHPYRNEIMTKINDHPVVIIVADTGSGKTTQLPQFLLGEGRKALVTQPRRLAARTVGERVAEEVSTPFGEVVGYRTAFERCDSEQTRCLFVTDGLALVRQLMGAYDHDVLMIDEAHERNLNVDVLMAWVKLQVKQNPKFKVVITSATLEAGRLSEYFDNAPVINVPGRTFPVEVRPTSGARLEDDVATLLRQGHNVLVFQPGKQEINDTMGRLNRAGLDAEILPLHGDMSAAEQAKCFRGYSRPKCVVSTNVAQTSVTIPDIDAVVDSGMERRIELEYGIEGLYLKPISLADRDQRKGRAGRTKNGIYIDWCPVPESERLKFPKPEILRVRLDQAVLRLAEAGIDMEGLSFFDPPDPKEVRDAKRALVALGCMDENGQVTSMGRRIARMPISVKYGRMIIEAEKRGVVADVITIAAILEQRGLTARVCPTHKQLEEKNCDCWKRLAPGEIGSDAIAQLRVYKACKELTTSQMREGGVMPKAYSQAREKRRHLADVLRGMVKEFQSSGDREEILKAVCAGMVDHLYQYRAGQYIGGDDQARKLSYGSVVQRTPGWIVGEPLDIESKGKYGPITHRLVLMGTKINLKWLIDIAPELIRIETGVRPRFSDELGEVVSTTETCFNGRVILSEETLDPNHEQAPKLRREAGNKRQWEVWLLQPQPEIVLPDLTDDQAVVPEIVTHVYGKDVATGEPLFAYGAVTKKIRYSPYDPWFKGVWTRSYDDAEGHRRAAVEHLESSRAQAQLLAERSRAEAGLRQLRNEARPLVDQLRSLYDAYYSELSYSLRLNLTRSMSMTNIFDRIGLERWQTQARQLIADAEGEATKVNQRRQETERRLADLSATAKSSRDEINELLVSHGDDFGDTLYGRLVTFDIGDDELPKLFVTLEIWVQRAQRLLSDARQFLEHRPKQVLQNPGGVSLAGLKQKFNSR